MDGAQDTFLENCPFRGPCCLGGLHSTKWLCSGGRKSAGPEEATDLRAAST